MSAELLLQFFEQFARSIGETIAQLTAVPVADEVLLNQEQADTAVWASVHLQGEGSQQIAIGCSQKAGLLLARAMLSEVPAEEATFGPDDEELLAEFWRQAMGRASTDLEQTLGGSQLEYVSANRFDWQSAGQAVLNFTSEKLSCTLVVHLSMEATRRLANAAADAASSPSPAPAANNLDLLLNVPLAVTLRFGKQQMPLRNILKLASGSVIELDRQAEDPVDLLLDERLIARGQVVVVDGCYGLRVTEVCH